MRALSPRSLAMGLRHAIFSGLLGATYQETCPMQIISPKLGPGVYAVRKTTLRAPVDARPPVHAPNTRTFGTHFTANMKGKLDAARGEGSKPLAAFYSALMDRMKMMEAQRVPISVVA